MSDVLRLLLVTPHADNNSLGRTHCLWLLARQLGWAVEVVSVRGEQLWEPLRDDPFAADCRLLAGAAPARREQVLRELAAAADLVVAVKPLPSSFGVALPLAARAGRPLLLDVDDPDLEARTTGQPLRRVVRDRVLSGRHRELVRLGQRVREVPLLVSNPVLQERYGGVVVPHVRPEAPPPTRPEGRDLVVRFVGSPRGHKGVDLLRDAVARRAGDGLRLEVTAPPPPDARPWEAWLGQTSFAEGRRLVATADVVALASTPGAWGDAQLPAKLVDALVLGRAVVASDLPPVRWALGDAGLLVPPGDGDALAAALERLRDPGLRGRLGRAAHARGTAMFGVRALAPVFEAYVRDVVRAGPVRVPAGAAGRDRGGLR